MLFFSSFLRDFTTSSWVISRPNPRSTPSTSRRYLIFSPKVILQSVIMILQFAILVKPFRNRAIGALVPGPRCQRRPREWTGASTDSVDAEDGAIDSFGTLGYSPSAI